MSKNAESKNAEASQAALIAAAQAVRAHAHAPYSRFAVGAAVLDDQGRIHAGCNVENAAYPQGVCAEAAALCGHDFHGLGLAPCGV